MSHSNITFENQRVIQPPPTLTVLVKDLDKNRRDGLQKALTTMKRTVAKLREINSYAKVDLTVLNNLIYKNHNRFRNDKGFRDLKLVKKAALRLFQEVQLDNLVEELAANMPVPFDIKTSAGVYLPVAPMAEHLMVRLHGTAKLALATAQYCENAAAKSKQKMGLGHFWNVALYCSACVSRLWALSISTLSCILETYEEFSNFCPCLPSQQNTWLPSGYKLPESLLADITHSKEHLAVIKKKIEDCCPTKKASSTNITSRLSAGPHKNIQDVGVIVQRDSIPQSLPDLTTEEAKASAAIPIIPTKKWKKIVKSVTQLTESSDSLAKFISDESGHRKRDRKTAVTKSLSQDQWKEMRGQLKDTLSEIMNAKSSDKTLSSAKFMILYWLADPSFKGSKPSSWESSYSKYTE